MKPVKTKRKGFTAKQKAWIKEQQRVTRNLREALVAYVAFHQTKR